MRCELEPLGAIISTINLLLETANDKIIEHNRIVDNFHAEKVTLTQQVWKYIVDEIRDEIKTYKDQKMNCYKAINSLHEQIKTKNGEKSSSENEIRSLESKSTSILPTINHINKLLAAYGFNGFKLAQGNKNSTYKLVRSDGSDAKETLSEGEKTFVTFLYFYHLLTGSHVASGVVSNRVVVIDDPISSLDSDVLFVVSQLIKSIMDKVRSTPNNVKQLFILTHNIYFHKEVTFNARRRASVLKEETFWIIRKSESGSHVEKKESNPITTSYKMLWDDIKRKDIRT